MRELKDRQGRTHSRAPGGFEAFVRATSVHTSVRTVWHRLLHATLRNHLSSCARADVPAAGTKISQPCANPNTSVHIYRSPGARTEGPAARVDG